ncbi:7-keto-8-aminopelargonate synthetase-like enzyme [Galbibacter orientalis DSM 19592]|uniref:7-keto-8-aminopelargonate synthetase-like enzyme n=1 Tax=Galbibacter orientalis DSM 19592 TaxID=926559 RepID=I3C4T7_9FLAO|nr:pyridoxal phosphate-dependent aminotransferase family protein [Galbibacter orientalis]EIJ38630.1 7-keto-8-aminopelargonate synthetase-like enzyme [Galbibacter orientalis DSM 19592]
MTNFPKKLSKKLATRKLENAFRVLPEASNLIDFSSNDYLGFSNAELIFSETQNILKERSIYSNGATGSRLISGNSLFYTEVEKEISTFHNSEEALVFNSGYDANLGFFSSVPQRGDIVLFDEYIHASIRDGIRLSTAKAFKFKHNDLKNLKEQLLKFSSEDNEVFVVTEAVFSMDGDSPNLVLLSDICEAYQAHLIVDEAHAVGVFGTNGEGLVQSLGLENKVFARIITFGKAFGCHGAAIIGASELVSYLVNFARSFIYTTGLPPHSLATIMSVYKQLKENNKQSLFRSNSEKLKNNIDYFKTTFKANKSACNLSLKYIESDSPIQCFIIQGNETVKLIAEKIKGKGYNVKPILSPTVPKGEERLRFCIHSFNSFNEISEVLSLFFAQYKN